MSDKLTFRNDGIAGLEDYTTWTLYYQEATTGATEDIDLDGNGWIDLDDSRDAIDEETRRLSLAIHHDDPRVLAPVDRPRMPEDATEVE